MIFSSRLSRRFSARKRESSISSGFTAFAGPGELPRCHRPCPVAQALLDQRLIFCLLRQGLSVLDPLHRQFLELPRVCLLRYLHSFVFQSNVILRHSWKTKFRGKLRLARRRLRSGRCRLRPGSCRFALRSRSAVHSLGWPVGACDRRGCRLIRWRKRAGSVRR